MKKLLLKVKNEETYLELMQLLKSFDSEKLEIFGEGIANERKELQAELAAIDSGTSDLKSLSEVDCDLDRIISEYED